jgi:hypothetical protein
LRAAQTSLKLKVISLEEAAMRYRISGLLLLLAGFVALTARPASAAAITDCSADFSICYIPENVFLQFPPGFLAISGDVVLEEPDGSASDVFRIFNDLFDTGGGTGLGTTAFLYSAGDSTPLPDPSTYSANVQFIPESTASPQTFYLGDGTIYVLNSPEPSTLALFVIGSIALFIVHRKRAPVWKTALFVTMAFLCLPAFSQTLPAAAALPYSVARYDKPLAMGSPQSAAALAVSASVGLPFHTASYASLGGRRIPISIVGTNPALGANTTTVNTVIVPLNIQFPGFGAFHFDATAAAAATAASPIFAPSDYSTGGTDLGVTQYGDAILRAQFWNLPGFSPDYHVLLGGPAIAPSVTISIPPGAGTVYQLDTGTLLGVVEEPLFDYIVGLLTQNFSAQVLPIFLTDNVFLSATGQIDGACCVLGYHTSQGPPIATAQTWIFASYIESGTFSGDAVLDVQGLSHEVGEWLNDPFAGAPILGGVNLVPPAVLPNEGGECIINFESADPLESPPIAFTQVTGGRAWHVTEHVFLPWYLHTAPSFSVNGFYSYLNTFPTYSTLCGPG